MTERPILFSAEMVRAIIEGRKTQTRRALKWHDQDDPGWQLKGMTFDGQFWKSAGGRLTMPCPYGQTGDRLWVREAWTIHAQSSLTNRDYVYYRADIGNTYLDGTWKPSIFMPRWASRITLEITEVRVQRVQDISTADAEQEGVRYPVSPAKEAGKVVPWIAVSNPLLTRHLSKTPWTHDILMRAHWAALWESINAKREGGIYAWDRNPWVWAVSFKRIFPK
jgi:hypothetical protein